MKKALINDWYNQNGGAEKVIHSINNIWDDLDHFALVDFLDNDQRNFILHGKNAKTSFIQKLPFAKKNHRKYLQLFPIAIEQFDLRKYDLIISSSSSIAKGILTNSNQLHICYCHSPIRYAWDLYHQYLDEANLNKGLKGVYAKYVLHKIRIWDALTPNRVDYFIANSKYIAARIKKLYNRDALIIYPPVDCSNFTIGETSGDYYFTTSRMVPYKKISLIIEAFAKMPDKKLIVAGDGPDYKKISKLKTPNIELLGFLNDKILLNYTQAAKAFIFAAEEDFGIAPIEAQACGIPVIAFGKGGALETIVGSFARENKIKNTDTGIFFEEQTVESVNFAINLFENNNFKFDKQVIRNQALKFSKERFEKELKAAVDTIVANHKF